MSDTQELGYIEWHAEVARLIAEAHPALRVTHEAELGGGVNAVVVDRADGMVVVLNELALTLFTAEAWYEGEGNTDGEDGVEFSDDECMTEQSAREAASAAESWIA